MKKRYGKKLLAGILSLTMLCSQSLIPLRADISGGGVLIGTGGPCPHHEHKVNEGEADREDPLGGDEDCGYTEGTACAHVCDEACVSTVEDCVHKHTEDCYGDEDRPKRRASSSDAPEADECSHFCDEESGCVKDIPDCSHKHGENDSEDCGYAAGTPCTFDPKDCLECSPGEDSPPEIDEAVQEELTITAFAPLPEEIRYQRTGADSLVLPETLTATVGTEESEIPVTWDGLSDINAKSGGLYTLTANVGEDYALAEDVELPVITAMVMGQSRIAGKGTEADPLQITNETQLREVAELVNAGRLEYLIFGGYDNDKVYLKLMNDITVNGEWEPIGSTKKGFDGIFDGNGCSIFGVRINQPDSDAIGLFGNVLYGSMIKNLRVEDAEIIGKGKVGGVAGAIHGKIENCYVSGSVSGEMWVGGVAGLTQNDITDCRVSAGVSGQDYVGGIAGFANNGNIAGCDTSGSVSGTNFYIGGIAGLQADACTISRCYATGDVSGASEIGGVVGNAKGDVTLCYSSGNVRGINRVGGVAGILGGADITNCYATGDVSSTSGDIGGVVGTLENGRISGCYATGDVNGDFGAGGVVGYSYENVSVTNCAALNDKILGAGSSDAFVGRVVGKMDGGFPEGANTAFAQMTNVGGDLFQADDGGGQNGTDIQNLVTLDDNFNDTGVWTAFDEDSLPALAGVGQQTVSRPSHLRNLSAGYGFSGGDGTGASPYQITTEQDLRALAHLVNSGSDYDGKHFKLTKDISLTGGWTPIGINVGAGEPSDKAFQGIFDGGGNTLSGVYINRPETSIIGLFGYIGRNSEIENLKVDVNITGRFGVGGVAGNSEGKVNNCFVSGRVSGHENLIGGVVGWSAGAVTNCYSTASVSGAGANYVGGVAGNANGAVTGCSATGDVTGGSLVGGVVGNAIEAVTSCYATGNVAGEGHVGGVAGNAMKEVTSCYATGNVTGESNVGGVAGRAEGESIVTGCYATGNVTGESLAGGVVGYAAGIIKDCAALNHVVSGSSDTWRVAGYINTGSGNVAFAGVKDKYGSRFPADGDNGLNGTDILSIDTLDGKFNDTSVWSSFTPTQLPNFREMEPLERPLHLFSIVSDYTFGGGTGESGSPYQIATEAHLRALAKLVNWGSNYNGKYFILTGDITLTGVWTPIGTEANPFGGTFDGGGKSVSGLKINQPESQYQGLFGYTASGSELKNLRLLQVDVNGKSNVGGAAGYAGGAVINCSVTGWIAGSDRNVGGITGISYNNTVKDCSFAGSVSGKGNVGGVAGYAQSTVTDCSAGGKVTGTGEGENLGGLVGDSRGAVTNCYTAVDVFGESDYVGGVAGNASGAVTGCYATGNVRGTGFVGGVAGRASSMVSQCIALNASVTGEDVVTRVFWADHNGSGKENYAFMGMDAIQNDYEKPLMKGTDKEDGGDAVLTEIQSAGWWKAAGFNHPWITADGRLPVLVSGASDVLPIHLTSTFVTMPVINGLSEWETTEGYSHIVWPLNIESDYLIAVSKQSGDEKITYNSDTYSLEVAPGLMAGEYPVVLEVSNLAGKVTCTFTLRVYPILYIEGPETMRLTEGYAAASSEQFFIISAVPVTVTFINVNEKITWNETTQRLDIAPGLKAGKYIVSMKFSNPAKEEEHVFKLTVESAGSSSSSDRGNTTSVPDKSSPTTDTSTTGLATVTAPVDSNGNATVHVTEKAVTDAIRAAQEQAKKDGLIGKMITVEIVANTDKTPTQITVILPKAVQDTLIGNKAEAVRLTTDTVSMTFSQEIILQLSAQAKADVTITAAEADTNKLTGDARTLIGNRPMFDFSIIFGNGNRISDFGSNTVSIAMPYTLGEGEVPGRLCAFHVEGNSKADKIINSSYDANQKAVIFTTSHFSVFGVGYEAAAAFADTADHWAKDSIDFVAARGLLSGTGNNQFSPDIGMTRGMFVTALGRLANVNTADYQATIFTDVKSDACYAPYVSWAKANNIVSGTSETTFAPDMNVTRQEMAVIMSNYAKVMGCKAPEIRAADIFADNSSIAGGAAAAVKQMQMAGIVNGKDGNRFDPTGTATRAEVAAVLRRYVELVIDIRTAQGLDVNDSGSAVMYENGKAVKSASRTTNGETYNFNANGEAALPPTRKNGACTA